MRRRIEPVLGAAALLLACPGVAGAADGGLRVWVGAVATTPAARARLGDALDARPSAIVAQGVSDLRGFEAVTEEDAPEGARDLGALVERAKRAEADLLLRTDVGLLGEELLLTASLVHLAQGRVVARELQGVAGAAQLGQALAALGSRLLGAGADTTKAAPPSGKLPPGKALVSVSRIDAALADEGGRVALERRVAGAVSGLEGHAATAREELGDQLRGEELQRLLGTGSPEALAELGAAAKTRYLVVLTAGKAGGVTVVAGSLIDTEERQVVGRDSLLLPDPAQLADAADTVALGLFGQERPLPAPPAEASRFESAMAQLAAGVKAAYLAKPPSALSRLAVLPLTDRGADARDRSLGKEAAGYLRQVLGGDERIRLVDARRLDELAGAEDLDSVADLPPEKLQELGTFLGASALVVGSASGIGSDFLLRARLLRMPGGETVGGAHALFPMGEPGSLMKKAFVVRTRAGAVFRSVLPGWGQFYNGPDHHWKGYLVAGGTLLGAGLAVTGMVLAGQRTDQTADWEPGGPEYINQCRPSDESKCHEEMSRLQDEADRLRTLGLTAAIAGGAFWLFGVVDAAVNAEDHSEAVYGVTLLPLDEAWVGVLRASW